MKKAGWICLAGCLLLGATAVAVAQDKEKIIAERQDAMKQQSRDLVVVRNYAQGKAEQPAALAAIEAAQKSVAKVPDWFPAGTGIGETSVKNRAKPEIWTQHDKFLADQKTVVGQLAQLEAAVKAADKAKAESLVTEIGACRACHDTFRAKSDQ